MTRWAIESGWKTIAPAEGVGGGSAVGVAVGGSGVAVGTGVAVGGGGVVGAGVAVAGAAVGADVSVGLSGRVGESVSVVSTLGIAVEVAASSEIEMGEASFECASGEVGVGSSASERSGLRTTAANVGVDLGNWPRPGPKSTNPTIATRIIIERPPKNKSQPDLPLLDFGARSGVTGVKA